MFGLSKIACWSILLFTGNQWLEHFYIIPFVHAYLDDLLCPLAVMGLSLAFFQHILLQDGDFVFPWHFLVVFWLFYGLLFEGLLPLYDARHYADPWDLLAYALGSLLFYLYGNRPYLRARPT